YTHDLVLLARLAKLPLSAVQEQLLHTITTFNISGRYDDYKLQFYKRATASYTKKFLTKTKTLYVWLQKKD
ncbi:DNA-binding protein, partial [Candidatus Uhrbacteria bacterium]|nr:DNA-binding protein [Candidatus Uhrbacteria bacterium]